MKFRIISVGISSWFGSSSDPYKEEVSVGWEYGTPSEFFYGSKFNSTLLKKQN